MSGAPQSRSEAPTPRSGPVVVLTCGDDARRRWASRLAASGRPDGDRPGPVLHHAPDRPGRAVVDPLLDAPALAPRAQGRIVVAGTDADLAAVLVRLLRRDRLDLPVGFLPDDGSAAAAVWGLPTGSDAAVTLAVDGTARTTPLVRDDRGGVVAGRHAVGAFSGVVYCDEREVLRGDAAGLEIWPDPDGGVAVVVSESRRLAGLRRGGTRADRGRATTIGCRPAAWTRDGVPEDRPLERRSWYRHTEDWWLVRPETRQQGNHAQ